MISSFNNPRRLGAVGLEALPALVLWNVEMSSLSKLLLPWRTSRPHWGIVI